MGQNTGMISNGNYHDQHPDGMKAKIGMWLFLFTEVLLFGGLFLLYAVYRSSYSSDFHYGASTLSVAIGTLNTIVLLTSSLTMVLGVHFLSLNRRRISARYIAVTIGLGLFFMLNKGVEWSEKIHHGIYPNSPDLAGHPPGESIFYSLYYAMTGLHALHVLIGLGILIVLLVRIRRRPREVRILPRDRWQQLTGITGKGRSAWPPLENPDIHAIRLSVIYREHHKITMNEAIRLDNAGLYWHMVDVIWIFLFPLFYLIT